LALAIDTLKFAEQLREAGFSDTQAEAVVATVQEASVGADLATRSDLGELRSGIRLEIAELRAELKADIAELRAKLKTEIAELRAELRAEIADLRAEIAAVRGEMRQLELRFEAKLEALKADILNRMFGLILGAVVVNVVAIVGAISPSIIELPSSFGR
jgi:flagellar motility protein MotE (MotC chaperone)